MPSFSVNFFVTERDIGKLLLDIKFSKTDAKNRVRVLWGWRSAARSRFAYSFSEEADVIRSGRTAFVLASAISLRHFSMFA